MQKSLHAWNLLYLLLGIIVPTLLEFWMILITNMVESLQNYRSVNQYQSINIDFAIIHLIMVGLQLSHNS